MSMVRKKITNGSLSFYDAEEENEDDDNDLDYLPKQERIFANGFQLAELCRSCFRIHNKCKR